MPVAVERTDDIVGPIARPGPPPSKSFQGSWNFTQLMPSP